MHFTLSKLKSGVISIKVLWFAQIQEEDGQRKGKTPRSELTTAPNPRISSEPVF